MTGSQLAFAPAAVGNDDAPWDGFDSDEYFAHNYGQLRHDDAQIIEIVADFFVHSFERSQPRRMANAIDVGPGANLYPALTMLPFSSRVTLFERSHSNRQWLTGALAKPQPSWRDQFWRAIAAHRPAYQTIRDPLDVLAGRAEVTKGNVFALEPEQYDIGTMFFVAESITTQYDEFQRAAQHFIGSLFPGAPFAAAFMCRSEGYYVGSTFFPAYPVDVADVEACLAPIARLNQVVRIDSDDLRDGYSGMIVATGWKK